MAHKYDVHTAVSCAAYRGKLSEERFSLQGHNVYYRKEKPEVCRDFRFFYILAGKTKLKVFEGEFEGDSPRGGEMSAKLTRGRTRSGGNFFQKVQPSITHP